MSTMAKQHSRADRLREYAATVEVAAMPVAAMGVLVRAREARPWTAQLPPEVVFAATPVDERALPASVWVALRRDDVGGAVEAMIGASQTAFLVESREEMGEGYRLQTVEETRPLPEVELLLGQLSAMLDIPVDVLAMLGEWGPDDPRTATRSPTCSIAGSVPTVPDPALRRAPPTADGLPMSVADAADVLRPSDGGLVMSTARRRVPVLRLSEEQARALATRSVAFR